ncbi:MAG: hypothetical protein NVSMB65_20590 [Chloroflexota bacterium]
MTARILAIDESTDILALYDAILALGGYEVHVCAEGDAALDSVRALDPDVIILDGHMVGAATQSTLIDLLLHEEPGISRARLLLCSGDGRFVDAYREVITARGGDVLRKPFQIADLLTLVARLTSPPRAPHPQENLATAP